MNILFEDPNGGTRTVAVPSDGTISFGAANGLVFRADAGETVISGESTTPPSIAAYFSPDGYLAANPDVRASGIDPLTHFEQSGWKEGRDPSNFDVRLYLLHNPDVAAAGIDPLEHYVESGQFEGRQA